MLINLFVFLLFINLLLQESQLRTQKGRGKIIFPPLQNISQSPIYNEITKEEFTWSH